MKFAVFAFAVMVCILAYGNCFDRTRCNACRGDWILVGCNVCVKAKDNGYGKFKNSNPSSANKFIIGMKLVHRRGTVGCTKNDFSNWGCWDNGYLDILVTDTRDTIIYPSPTLTKLDRTNNDWYRLPGYDGNSTKLVFQEVGFRYLYKDQEFRIWYGEDLFDKDNDKASDNRGETCMDVYVYVVPI